MKRDAQTREGRLYDTLLAGDQVQILYNSDKEQYVSLLSIDSRGVVSFYHPQQNSPVCSVPVGKGKGLFFPGSIELDAEPGFELVIAIFSESALETTFVQKWIKRCYKDQSDLSKLISDLKKMPPQKKLHC